jgi:hypothetical protein
MDRLSGRSAAPVSEEDSEPGFRGSRKARPTGLLRRSYRHFDCTIHRARWGEGAGLLERPVPGVVFIVFDA